MDVFIEFFSSLPFADEIVGAVLPVLIGLVFGFAKDVCKRGLVLASQRRTIEI